MCVVKPRRQGHDAEKPPGCPAEAAATGRRCARANTDVLHYLLDIEVIPESQWIGGSNTITVRSLIDNLTLFYFRLDTILDITAVRVGQTPVTWTQVDEATVEVVLDRAYRTSEQFELYVAYQGNPHSTGSFGSITVGFRPPGACFSHTTAQPW